MNLGFDPYYEDEEINPIVLNGLNTKTKSHDFFSMKGNGYKKATVEPLRDDDFFFSRTSSKSNARAGLTPALFPCKQ